MCSVDLRFFDLLWSVGEEFGHPVLRLSLFEMNYEQAVVGSLRGECCTKDVVICMLWAE